MRQYRFKTFLVCCLVWSMCLLPVRAEENGQDLTLYATAAVLMDADSGRILYEKNGNDCMAMASTTKIMTCILALEYGNGEAMVDISSYAASMPKVKLYVKKGEQYQLQDLLYSLMLESHNDAAAAIAEHIGRGLLGKKAAADADPEESERAIAAFAELMNRKAMELGCENTWFITPNGLDATQTISLDNGETVAKEHCTTAADLARIMSYCITSSPKKEEFLVITQTPSYTFDANGRSYSCVNHNAFLTMMEGAISGKTGFTNKAGYCYVGALERDGRTFVVALLACGWPNHKTYKWSDTRKLMEYGLNHYTYHAFSEAAYDEKKLVPILVLEGQTPNLDREAYTGVEIRGRNTGGGSLTGPDDQKADRNDWVDNMDIREGEELLAGEEGAAGTNEAGIGERADIKGASSNIEGAPEGLLMREDESIQVDCQVKKTLKAPVEAGTEVGTITYSVGGTVYKTEQIVTTDSIGVIDYEWCFRQIWERFSLH